MTERSGVPGGAVAQEAATMAPPAAEKPGAIVSPTRKITVAGGQHVDKAPSKAPHPKLRRAISLQEGPEATAKALEDAGAAGIHEKEKEKARLPINHGSSLCIIN